jgi:hypothetical protein
MNRLALSGGMMVFSVAIAGYFVEIATANGKKTTEM